MINFIIGKYIFQKIDSTIGSLHDLIMWPAFGKHENSSLLKNFVSTSWKSILKLGNLRIFCRSDCNSRRKLEAFVWEKNFCHPVTPAWFSTQILVISKFSKLSWNISAKVVFLIQILLTFGVRCNRYFWEIRLKILRSPNFNMLFQLVLTKCFKSELFSCLPKVGHVIKSCKEPIMLSNKSLSSE